MSLVVKRIMSAPAELVNAASALSACEESDNDDENSCGVRLSLANWEQWGLSMEEYHHSMQLFESNPMGKPMGHS